MALGWETTDPPTSGFVGGAFPTQNVGSVASLLVPWKGDDTGAYTARLMTTVAPLRIRRFRTLWVASIFSNVGSFLQTVAASWLMLELTNSATWVGLMAASSTLPLLFLSLAAGAVADMFDRRWVLVAAQTAMGAAAAAMAILTYMDRITRR